MDQPNSKINRKKEEFGKEHTKKIQMQELNEKNERKENQGFYSEDENSIMEKEQYRASKETMQSEKRAETRYPGNRMDKKDSDSDKAIDKGAITLERTDDGEYTNLHNYPLHKTNCNGSALAQSLCLDTHELDSTENNLFGKNRCQNLGKTDTNNDLDMKVNKRAEEKVSNECGQSQEQDLNPEFIDIQFRRTTIYFTRESNTIFDTDRERVNQDGPARKQTKVNSTNSEKFARSENRNATYTAEERLMKYVKNIHMRTNLKINKPINTASSKLSKALYDIYSKCLCAQILSFKNYKHHFTFNPVRSNNDRPLNVYVYAIGFKGGSMLMGAYEDKRIIKCILETQTLREMYLGDEHFRLATFSLSVFNYEMGEIIRLAGSGFFCDADGGVKCYCCGNPYRGEQLNSHHPDCELHTSDGHVGRSIADHYGESAPGTLVPSGQNVQEYRTEACIDIQIQMRTFSYRLGRTQEVFLDNSLVPEDEINENENELSVREGSMQPSQETEYSTNTFSVREIPMPLRQETLQSSNGLTVREVPMPSRPKAPQSSNVLSVREVPITSRPETPQSSNGLSMRECPIPSRQRTPHSALEFSVTEGPMHSTQETPLRANIEEPVSGSRVNNMGVLYGNQGSCVSFHGHEGSLGLGSEGVPLNIERRTCQLRESSNDLLPLGQTERHMLNTGRRTIKEDVNRGSPTNTARLVAENARLKIRTLCCKCNNKRCNIVFKPCGHLVVCNQCVSNTIECPMCKKKVNEAHEVGD